MTLLEQRIQHWQNVRAANAYKPSIPTEFMDAYKAMLKELRAHVAKDRELLIQTAAQIFTIPGIGSMTAAAHAAAKLIAAVDALAEPVEAPPAPRPAPALQVPQSQPCKCGQYHPLEEFRPAKSGVPGMKVRTKVLKHADIDNTVIPAFTIGEVVAWSQYGSPLYYCVRFDIFDRHGDCIRHNYVPCELEKSDSP